MIVHEKNEHDCFSNNCASQNGTEVKRAWWMCHVWGELRK